MDTPKPLVHKAFERSTFYQIPRGVHTGYIKSHALLTFSFSTLLSAVHARNSCLGDPRSNADQSSEFRSAISLQMRQRCSAKAKPIRDKIRDKGCSDYPLSYIIARSEEHLRAVSSAVEQRLHTAWVASSILAPPTIFGKQKAPIGCLLFSAVVIHCSVLRSTKQEDRYADSEWFAPFLGIVARLPTDALSQEMKCSPS